MFGPDMMKELASELEQYGSGKFVPRREPYDPEPGHDRPPNNFIGYRHADLASWRSRCLDAKIFIEATRQNHEILPDTAGKAVFRMVDGYPALLALTNIILQVVVDPKKGGVPGHNKLVVMCNNPQVGGKPQDGMLFLKMNPIRELEAYNSSTWNFLGYGWPTCMQSSIAIRDKI